MTAVTKDLRSWYFGVWSELNVADFAGVQNSVSLATTQVQLHLVQKQYCYKAAAAADRRENHKIDNFVTHTCHPALFK
jgi:hypothetical protein